MKKRTFLCLGLLFSLILFSGIGTTAFSATNDSCGIESLIAESSATKEEYLSQMNDIMLELVAETEIYSDEASDEKILQGSIDVVASYDLENAYRVSVLEPLFLTTIKESGSFKTAITGVTQWKIPIVTEKGENGIAVLLENDGILSYVGLVVGEATTEWQITDDEIISAINTSSLAKEPFSYLQIVHSYLYNTTFVYLSTGKHEYLIPYSFYADEVKINNGELYTVSDIEKSFNLCFDESQIVDSPSYNGGAPFRQTSSVQPIIWGSLVVAFVAAFTVLGILLKRKGEVK